MNPSLKVASVKVVAKALGAVPEKEIGAVIGGLDGEEQALLMKYIYRSVTYKFLISSAGRRWADKPHSGGGRDGMKETDGACLARDGSSLQHLGHR